jgi:hypothetical protein
VTAEDELRGALGSLANALDALSVPWAIGGSYASSVHGEPRATNDLDLVASLRASHVQPFVAALGADFYTDATSIREAIAIRDSFNVIDERSFLKIDVFVPAAGAMGEGQLLRRRRCAMSESGPNVYVLGPEDTVLQRSPVGGVLRRGEFGMQRDPRAQPAHARALHGWQASGFGPRSAHSIAPSGTPQRSSV